MKVLFLKNIPATTELLDIMSRDFSNKYSYKLFGPSTEKSIIVSQSAFVGAQISKRGNEITVQGLLNPSTSSSFYTIVDFLFTGTGLLKILYGSSLNKLENEIGFYLKRKYA